MSQPHSTARMIRLDGLRGVAVLAVVLFHAGHFLVPSVAPYLLPGGFLGVDLFFVLSGFLMTNILLDPGRSYGRFYVRRAARIFPALYLLLVVHLAYSLVVGLSGGTNPGVYALISLGMGNWGNVFGLTVPFSIGQTWSLGVEEQLYFIWPLILLLCGRRHIGRLKWICMIGIALSMGIRALLLHSGVPMDHIYTQTEARLDDFLAGALVAAVRQTAGKRPRILDAATALAAGFLATCLALTHGFTSAWLYEGGFTAVAASCAIVLYGSLYESPVSAPLAWRPLRAAGRYSYAIYLWHPFVFVAVGRAFPGDTVLRVLWATTLLVVTSALSTLLLEEPLRRIAADATGARWRSVRRPITLLPSG